MPLGAGPLVIGKVLTAGMPAGAGTFAPSAGGGGTYGYFSGTAGAPPALAGAPPFFPFSVFARVV